MQEGRILESNLSNVFAVSGGRILTPPADGRNLAGVTRGDLVFTSSPGVQPIEDDLVPLHAVGRLEHPVVLIGEVKELAGDAPSCAKTRPMSSSPPQRARQDL